MASKKSSGSQPKPIPLTAEFLLQQALPQLSVKHKHHTTSKALSDIHFTGSLEPWDSFEEEVLTFCTTIKEEYDIENILGYTSSKPTTYDMSLEHFRCGEEISVSGRFVNNALHVMSAIGLEVGLTTVFGDWKATGEQGSSKSQDPGHAKTNEREGEDDEEVVEGIEETKRTTIKKGALVPDFSLFHSETSEIRAVGEAKTPWHHGLSSWWRDHGKLNMTHDLRHALGQIAQYMQRFELKYGFLTTYNSTLFLKQETSGSDVILHCSAPISRATVASSDNPSLRQCIFYLQYTVNNTDAGAQPWKFVNKIDGESGVQWFVKRMKKETSRQYKDRREAALTNVDESLEKWRYAQSKRRSDLYDESTDLELAGDLSKLNIDGAYQQTRKAKSTGRSKEVTFKDQ
ncbi:hypothetical protein FQN54_000653 [Arachnomyces sp. PD_36]|nr:hypothetical protein FQN54_000653 [Arachnomyces sp. PD_36]